MQQQATLPSNLGAQIDAVLADFGGLRALQDGWYVSGRDKGLNLDLEVSIDLARLLLPRAADADQRGAALNDLGLSLNDRGDRDAAPDRLTQAVAAYRAALKECARDRVPLDWAGTTYILANTLALIGDRRDDVAAIEAALPMAREAQEVLQAAGHVPWAEEAAEVIARIEAMLARRRG